MATKTLNIALDEKLITQVDRLVKSEMASRSEYFRRLALADIARRTKLQAVLQAGNKKGKKIGVKSEQQVYERLGV